MAGEVTFWDALRGCHNSGGNLAVLETQEEYEELAGVVTNAYCKSDQLVWCMGFLEEWVLGLDSM